MKTTRKKVTKRKSPRRTPALSLSARVERPEKQLLFATKASASTAPASRFVNLDANGNPTQSNHVAVYDSQTGLTWSAGPLEGGKDMIHADAMKACANLNLLGKQDWRAPTIQELLSIIDYSRCEPAVDTAHFQGPYGWSWTSTPAASRSGFAWFVNLSYGLSDRDFQLDPSHVRAVRAGQF